MNLLKTTDNGGFPLVLDDFRWIDEGYREAFYGLLSAFGVTSQYTFIFSGCSRSVSSGVVTIQTGYVSIGGEICRVPNHSYAEPSVGQFEFWTVDISTDPTGDKTFQNTDVNATYQFRTAVLSVGSSVPAGSTTYNQTQTLYQLIHANLPVDSWQTLITQTVVSPILLPGTYTVQFRKDLSGFIHLKGRYHTGEDPGSGVVDILVQTLPVGYRPVQNQLFTIGTINTSAAGLNIIQIGTNGQVRIKVLDADYVNLLDFSQIVPFEVI